MTMNELFLYIEKQVFPVSVSEITEAFPDLSRRTVQRWLGKLSADGLLETIGEGRSRKYISYVHSAIKEDPPVYGLSSSIPVSPDSRDIIKYLMQPVHARHSVGYDQEFLNSYVPNKSYYLSEPIRRQLHRIGTTGYETKPAGTYGRDIYNRILIDLSWASSHLEGNTYSKLDTVELLKYGNHAEGKAYTETLMILNHKTAIEMLIEDAELVEFNPYTILNIHGALSEGLLPEPEDEGRIRKHMVGIGGSVYKPMSSEELLSVQFRLILDKANQIEDPFEQSFFIMVHLPYLQPFADVNKRTSRLAANIPLLKANLCPLTFIGVPEEAYTKAILGVYEMNRVELLRDIYLWAYGESVREYVEVKRELVAPDMQKLHYRKRVKAIVREVILSPELSPLDIIQDSVSNESSERDKEIITALVTEELRIIHEGILVRYRLRPSELEVWKRAQEYD
ncbi:Fic family protein [Vibrio sp. JC009]|uniref:Fic family protein n=1 Tax=Vibrio sp. JC009 TaxID=2912314 RepID=UPI0023B055ED|nr:Fic family protein [Vibrio sp. JC009]WED22746.1 Fic family protein [Vibrio sp. JC009]